MNTTPSDRRVRCAKTTLANDHLAGRVGGGRRHDSTPTLSSVRPPGPDTLKSRANRAWRGAGGWLLSKDLARAGVFVRRGGQPTPIGQRRLEHAAVVSANHVVQQRTPILAAHLVPLDAEDIEDGL